MKLKASKRIKGCCGACGVHKGDSWDQRVGGQTLRRMGARRARRTRRNTIERYEFDY